MSVRACPRPKSSSLYRVADPPRRSRYTRSPSDEVSQVFEWRAARGISDMKRTRAEARACGLEVVSRLQIVRHRGGLCLPEKASALRWLASRAEGAN